MNDRTMVKVRCDKELLYIRTISWEKKSPHRFAILRSELRSAMDFNQDAAHEESSPLDLLSLLAPPDGDLTK